MAIAFVNTQTAQPSATSAWTVTKPTGTSSGHLLLACMTWEDGFLNNTSISGFPSGWANVTNSPFDRGNNYNRHAVAYKVAGGSEGADYTFTLNGATSGAIACIAYSGVDNSTPFDTTTVLSDTGSSDTSHVVASSTPITADCRLIHVIGATTNGGANQWTADGAMTERVDVGSTYHSLFVADEQLTGSAATGTRTHTSVGSEWRPFLSILLRPGASNSIAPLVAYYRQMQEA